MFTVLLLCLKWTQSEEEMAQQLLQIQPVLFHRADTPKLNIFHCLLNHYLCFDMLCKPNVFNEQKAVSECKHGIRITAHNNGPILLMNKIRRYSGIKVNKYYNKNVCFCVTSQTLNNILTTAQKVGRNWHENSEAEIPSCITLNF